MLRLSDAKAHGKVEGSQSSQSFSRGDHCSVITSPRSAVKESVIHCCFHKGPEATSHTLTQRTPGGGVRRCAEHARPFGEAGYAVGGRKVLPVGLSETLYWSPQTASRPCAHFLPPLGRLWRSGMSQRCLALPWNPCWPVRRLSPRLCFSCPKRAYSCLWKHFHRLSQSLPDHPSVSSASGWRLGTCVSRVLRPSLLLV